MTVSFQSLGTASATALLVCALGAAPTASAQMRIQTDGDYVVRASTVSAANLPHRMRVKHGIPTAPNTAVLNVTVQRKSDGVLRNVPARVDVQTSNLLGVETGVDMRATVANDLVSYMGTYTFLPREVIDFRITALPEGAEQAITLQFRDRLGFR